MKKRFNQFQDGSYLKEIFSQRDEMQQQMLELKKENKTISMVNKQNERQLEKKSR